MNLGNVAPRARIEPTSFAFRARVLTFTPPKLTDVTTRLYGSLPERSVQSTTLLLLGGFFFFNVLMFVGFLIPETQKYHVRVHNVIVVVCTEL